MRGSMSTCAFTSTSIFAEAAADGSSSKAEVTNPTAIDDGDRHTFTFSKGSQASEDAGGLGKKCISLTIDDGDAVTDCTSFCSWVETDTFFIGGLPEGFNRDGQGSGDFYPEAGGFTGTCGPSRPCFPTQTSCETTGPQDFTDGDGTFDDTSTDADGVVTSTWGLQDSDGNRYWQSNSDGESMAAADQSTCEEFICVTQYEQEQVFENCAWTPFNATWDDSAVTSVGDFVTGGESIRDLNVTYSIGCPPAPPSATTTSPSAPTTSPSAPTTSPSTDVSGAARAASLATTSAMMLVAMF